MIEQIATDLRTEPEECFFWSTHTGTELDLLVARGGEIKLTLLEVIHAGDRTFDLAPRIRAVGLPRLLEDIRMP